MIRELNAEQLGPWLVSVKVTDIAVLRNFALGLGRYVSAVHVALMLPWSNGPTGGHVHWLKLIKRKIYGPANLELRRRRVPSLTNDRSRNFHANRNARTLRETHVSRRLKTSSQRTIGSRATTYLKHIPVQLRNQLGRMRKQWDTGAHHRVAFFRETWSSLKEAPDDLLLVNPLNDN